MGSERIDGAGAWHHVMSRANGGDLLFRDDLDRRRFLGLLSELPKRFSLELQGFSRWPGVSYASAARGIRRFWKRAPNSPEMQAFVAALPDQLSNG